MRYKTKVTVPPSQRAMAVYRWILALCADGPSRDAVPVMKILSGRLYPGVDEGTWREYGFTGDDMVECGNEGDFVTIVTINTKEMLGPEFAAIMMSAFGLGEEENYGISFMSEYGYPDWDDPGESVYHALTDDSPPHHGSFVVMMKQGGHIPEEEDGGFVSLIAKTLRLKEGAPICLDADTLEEKLQRPSLDKAFLERYGDDANILRRSHLVHADTAISRYIKIEGVGYYDAFWQRVDAMGRHPERLAEECMPYANMLTIGAVAEGAA